MKLSTCNYIDVHINVIMIGATRSGNYVVSALENATCKKTKVVSYIRLPDV